MKQGELVFTGILVAIVAVAAFLIDNLVPARQIQPAQDKAGPFLSSGWYCPSPTAGDDFQASMVTSNLGERTLGLRRLAIGGARQADPLQGNLEAGRSGAVPLADFKLPDATGLVDAFSESSATDLVVLARGKGAAASRCSDQPSDRWLFASASTSRGENNVLLVANPFQEEAVVRVRFIAPDKDFVPALLKDLVIPGESQVSVSLVEFLTEIPSFGMEVTATQGRVVVSRFAEVTRSGARGISLDIGEPAPSAEWTFADGITPENGEESLVIVNPGAREALVGVVFMTEGERTAPPALAELPVPAGRQITVNVAEYLPKGTSHGISLSSTNGEPVVVERRTTGGAGRGSGFDTTFGVPSTALRWAVSVGSPAGGSTTLNLVNPSDGKTSLKISLLGADGPKRPSELAGIVLESGRKVSIDVTPYLAGGVATALVESTGQRIAVESATTVPTPYSDVIHTSGRKLS